MPDPNCVLFRQHGIAFFGICKNANTSIKRAFLKSMGVEAHLDRSPYVHDPSLLTYAGAREIEASGLWSFAVVRNPYDRLLSCWRDKCFDGWKNAGAARWGLAQGMSFAAFVDRVYGILDEESINWGQHWRSQSYELLNGDRVVEPDCVIPFERLDALWGVVQSKSRIPLPDLGRDNATDPGPDPYTPELRLKVAARYWWDFELFGYVP